MHHSRVRQCQEIELRLCACQTGTPPYSQPRLGLLHKPSMAEVVLWGFCGQVRKERADFPCLFLLEFLLQILGTMLCRRTNHFCQQMQVRPNKKTSERLELQLSSHSNLQPSRLGPQTMWSRKSRAQYQFRHTLCSHTQLEVNACVPCHGCTCWGILPSHASGRMGDS